MCRLLADFLRETLRLGDKDQIRSPRKLALAIAFLASEQVRLGQRLTVARETGREQLRAWCRRCAAPLVENP